MSGGDRQGCHPTFQSGHSLFKDIVGGIHDPRIDVSKLFQGKQIGSVLRAVEGIGGGLVNGHRTRVGLGIRRMAGVQGLGAKAIIGLV